MRQVAIAWGGTLIIATAVFGALSIFAWQAGYIHSVPGITVPWTPLLIVILAFCCEYVDSTLGMGYGTTLTPLLMLLLGLDPLVIVPAVLLSELLTGISAGLLHHRAGNVDFRPGSPHFKVAGVLAACSIVGTLAAVAVALSLPGWALKTWIGVLVLAIGIVILLTRNKQYGFSWKKITGLGLVAAFNKGMSGGGYGPVVTGGQLLSGVNGKNAIGITSMAEGLTCVVGVLAYAHILGVLNWYLVIPLVFGALCSVPVSTYTVKKIRTEKLTVAIGITTTVLGVFTLLKVTGLL